MEAPREAAEAEDEVERSVLAQVESFLSAKVKRSLIAMSVLGLPD